MAPPAVIIPVVQSGPVLIAGAGIGGLSTALALARGGADVRVLERAPEVAEVGAGIVLWHNAVQAVEVLGLAAEVRGAGAVITGGGIRSASGRSLSSTPVRELDERTGTAAIALHRADLQRLLARALGEGRLQLGAELVGLEHNPSAVTAVLRDGRRVRGTALVAADGLHSTVRELLFGPRRARYAGYTAWRGVAALSHRDMPTGWASETWGCGRRFGLVDIGGGRTYWFAVARRPPGGRDANAREALLAVFAGWHRPVEAAVAATEHVLRHDVMHLPALRSWTAGRVALVGDAAHAMTPDLGQGACQALEDAVALADAMSGRAGVPAALRDYERRRRARATSLQRRSRAVGQVAQAARPRLCRLRDRALRAAPEWAVLRNLERIVGAR